MDFICSLGLMFLAPGNGGRELVIPSTELTKLLSTHLQTNEARMGKLVSHLMNPSAALL